MNITNEQKKAINRAKELFGQEWKNEIAKAWRTGVYRWGLDSNEIAELQRLRNKIGNSGLDKIK
ncbi:hypothetical protein [Thiolapillus sp.]|uniref:hypothetical protein n=1 Tax=Thiolapillus sp. TaxID=2017437 RepID=UPI003AF41C89